MTRGHTGELSLGDHVGVVAVQRRDESGLDRLRGRHPRQVSYDDEVTRRAGPVNGPDYDGVHAALVDAIKYVPSGQSPEAAAHEALVRLRSLGLPVPPRPPDDPSRDDGPPFAPRLADAPRHPEEPS